MTTLEAIEAPTATITVEPPTGRGFSPETVAAIKEHMKASELSFQALSKRSGLNVSILHECMSGKYKGRVEDKEAQVRAYLSVAKIQRQVPHGVFPTEITKQLFDAAANAKSRGLYVAVGLPGIGKTVAVNQYQEQDLTAIIVTARRGLRTTRGFLLRELRSRLTTWKWTRKDEREGTMSDDVLNRLRDSRRLIIADHADELTLDSLSFLLSLQEETSCSLLLVGAPRLHLRLEELASSGARGVASCLWSELRFTSTRSRNDAVDHLLDAVTPQHSDALRDAVRSAAVKNHGNLSTLAACINVATHLVESKGEPAPSAFDQSRFYLTGASTAAERLTLMEQRRAKALPSS